ncbi:hypothetical protein [Clostridium pasteurianum]|uniref:Uncharacterized protein n=1 Tax=Clostridium pasteurianum BC1 TaxID=86416 RepID=R4KAX1_CLOPA|nr:hypothetical protein [Clostridium pasteurianum]AGK98836.1 hypothetical protein Clopa_4097 [Clostridium pasteurianum BC1]
MLRLTPLEFFFRSIPECFLIVMMAHIFCNKTISKKLIAEATIILSILIYLIRLLPIVFGVHTVLGSIAFIIIGVYILNISINTSVASILVSVISIIICEFINNFILVYIFKINKFDNVGLRLIYTTPSLTMFMFIVAMFYIFMDKIKKQHSQICFTKKC